MRTALVLLLVACGGGSEKPPVAPQAPPPDAAIAVVEEPPPVEADGPRPQALPPADIDDERGLLREPRPMPPPSTITPASMVGYPPSCVAYLNTFRMLAQCDKLGPAQDSMKQGYDATVEAWEPLAHDVSPEAKQSWDEGCKAGLDGLKQTGAAMGCAL